MLQKGVVKSSISSPSDLSLVPGLRYPGLRPPHFSLQVQGEEGAMTHDTHLQMGPLGHRGVES